MTKKSIVRNALIGTALLGAVGLVTSTMLASAEPFDPSSVSVGFKKTKKKSAQNQRGASDKITTTCVEGTADYDIDQCYKDIKD